MGSETDGARRRFLVDGDGPLSDLRTRWSACVGDKIRRRDVRDGSLEVHRTSMARELVSGRGTSATSSTPLSNFASMASRSMFWESRKVLANFP